MKASQARQQAQSVIDFAFTENHEKVIDEIKKSVQDGKFEVMVTFDILLEVKKRLREDGFNVYETPDGRNGIDYRITW